MKIKIVILFALICGSLKSQDNYMSLSFGGAVPLGDFSLSNDLQTDGYAETGFLAEYTGVFYRNEFLGLVGSLSIATVGVNTERVLSDLDDLRPVVTDPDVDSLYQVGKWDVFSLKLGPQFTCPVGILSFDVYCLAGLYMVNTPGLSISGVKEEEVFYDLSWTDQKLTLGFEAGINVRISLSDVYGIKLFAGYQHTALNGEINSTTSDETSSYTPKIDLFTTGIGLIYRL